MNTPSSHRDRTLGLWLGVLGVAIFAVTLPATRLATGTSEQPQLSPWFVTVGRAALAGLLSAVFLLATRSPRPQPQQWRHLGWAVLGNALGYPLLLAFALRQRHGLLVYSASWFSLPQPPEVQGLFSAQEHRFGIHAGDIETSMMLHLAPGTVHMEHAQHFRSTSQDRAERFAILGNGKSAKMGWAMEDYHPSGAVGQADAATADKGRAVVQAAGAALVALLAEVAALPLDTVRVAGV